MLSKKNLEELEEFGGIHFTIRDCAVVLGCDLQELEKAISTPGTPENVAYEKGRLLSAAKLRQAIVKQAEQGSTPAQKQLIDIIEKTRDENAALKKDVNESVLVLFNDPKLFEDISKVSAAGMFAVVREYTDDQRQEKMVLKKVVGMSGRLDLSDDEIDVFSDDLTIIFKPEGNHAR